MRKPNPVIHMSLWGTAGGIITALVYLLLLLILFGASFDLWQIFGTASLYGGVPGAVLGLIDGFLIQMVMNDKFSESLETKRRKAQERVATITFIGMLVFLGVAISPMLFIYIYVSFVPPLLATFAAVYATKRYFKRVAELNGLKAKMDENEKLDSQIERLALQMSQQKQARANDFSRNQKSQNRN